MAAKQDGISQINSFDDVHLIHQAIPELDWQDVNLRTDLFGKTLNYPILINAMTGGTETATKINSKLATLAQRFGFGMAVGSQSIAIKDRSLRNSFALVRKSIPNGLVIANISARESVENARIAIDMIEADAIQLHFNVPQELSMPEGERNFKGVISNVMELAQSLPIPVIAKEVGFGFSREAIQQLINAGVANFDIGGTGGTNFIQIEDQRGGYFKQHLDTWGISTVCSLAETITAAEDIKVIASGGIKSAMQITKALALGADVCAMAGWFLKVLWNAGWEALIEQTQDLLYLLQSIFLMTGSSNIIEMKNKPVVITGLTAEYLRARDIDLKYWHR